MNNTQYTGILKALNPNMVAIGYEQVSITDAAVKSLAVPSGTKYCEMKLTSSTTTGAVAYYLNYEECVPADGTGIPIEHGTFMDLSNSDSIVNFRIICIAGLTATLDVQYYK